MTADAPRTAVGAFLRAALEHPAYWVIGAIVGLVVLWFGLPLIGRRDPFADQVMFAVGSVLIGAGAAMIWPLVVAMAVFLTALHLVGKKVDARRAARRQP